MYKFVPMLLALLLTTQSSAGQLLFTFENREDVSENHLLRFGYQLGTLIKVPLDEDVEIPAPAFFMPTIRTELASQYARFWFMHPAAPGLPYEFATMGDLCTPLFCAIPHTTAPFTQWYIEQVTHELDLDPFQGNIRYTQTVRIYGAIPEPATVLLVVLAIPLAGSLRCR